MKAMLSAETRRRRVLSARVGCSVTSLRAAPLCWRQRRTLRSAEPLVKSSSHAATARQLARRFAPLSRPKRRQIVGSGEIAKLPVYYLTIAFKGPISSSQENASCKTGDRNTMDVDISGQRDYLSRGGPQSGIVLKNLRVRVVVRPQATGGEGDEPAERVLAARVASWSEVCGLRASTTSPSPPPWANRVRFPAGLLPDFSTWKSCWTMLLVGGFSRGSPVSPALSFRRCSILTPITLIGSQGLTVKSCTNLVTHALTLIIGPEGETCSCSQPEECKKGEQWWEEVGIESTLKKPSNHNSVRHILNMRIDTCWSCGNARCCRGGQPQLHWYLFLLRRTFILRLISARRRRCALQATRKNGRFCSMLMLRHNLPPSEANCAAFMPFVFLRRALRKFMNGFTDGRCLRLRPCPLLLQLRLRLRQRLRLVPQLLLLRADPLFLLFRADPLLLLLRADPLFLLFRADPLFLLFRADPLLLLLRADPLRLLLFLPPCLLRLANLTFFPCICSIMSPLRRLPPAMMPVPLRLSTLSPRLPLRPRLVLLPQRLRLLLRLPKYGNFRVSDNIVFIVRVSERVLRHRNSEVFSADEDETS
ncbi:hypothetical protein PR048_024434 [Dryococelus australis]|uniref:Uncharacterized protein n=1 Tax=Dryococelus australis TaxID=614101 RepID=A0ABQ9GNM7_9NEOP|nr:hypothetical protein PR048_024434 [Dryococelus australis]